MLDKRLSKSPEYMVVYQTIHIEENISRDTSMFK